jgi:nucleotide-binding universal stress UspA family protein
MVHLDFDHPNDARLKITADLAARFDASVIGVTACAESTPLYFADGAALDLILEKENEEIGKRIKDLENRFRSSLSKRSDRVEWRSARIQPTAFLESQCRAADLIIIGAGRKDEPIDYYRQVDPGDFVTTAGRPVLMVPQEAESLKAERILVGWKDTRECRRAVYDALPLLRQSQQVIVAEIPEDNDFVAAQEHVEDVVRWMKAHGITAEARVAAPTMAPGLQLDALAGEENVDLIIAGAYGHSRLREWVFGGVTRDLVTSVPRCSLLSH